MWHGVTSLHISTRSSDRNTLSLLEPAARCSWMAAKQMVLSSAPRWPPSVKTRSESFMFISGSSACFHHDAAQREGWTWREGGRKHLLDDGNITSKCLRVDFVFYRNCACCISSSASFLFPKFLCLLFLINSFPFSIYFLSPFLTIPPFHPFLDPFSPFIFWHFFLIYFLALFSPFHFSFLKSLFFLCILPYFI